MGTRRLETQLQKIEAKLEKAEDEVERLNAELCRLKRKPQEPRPREQLRGKSNDSRGPSRSAERTAPRAQPPRSPPWDGYRGARGQSASPECVVSANTPNRVPRAWSRDRPQAESRHDSNGRSRTRSRRRPTSAPRRPDSKDPVGKERDDGRDPKIGLAARDDLAIRGMDRRERREDRDDDRRDDRREDRPDDRREDRAVDREGRRADRWEGRKLDASRSNSREPRVLEDRKGRDYRRDDRGRSLSRRSRSSIRRRSAQEIRNSYDRSDGQPLCFLYVIGKCRKGGDCPNRHPEATVCSRLLAKMQDTPCRNGKDCSRKDCVFLH